MLKDNNKNRSHTKNSHVKTLYVVPRLTEQDKTTILGDNKALPTQTQTILGGEARPLTTERSIPSVAKFQGELPTFSLPQSKRLKVRFKRIEAEHHPSHASRVQGLLDILKNAQRLELSPDAQKLATFFVADNKEYGVYGGAVLLKRRVLNARKNRDSHYAFQGEPLWTCAVGLSLTNKDPLHMSGDRVAFIRGFYKELYASLVAFGAERKAAFLWVTLDPQEALLLDKLGDFPFVLQIKPENTSDGLFHSLVALKDDLAMTVLKTRHWGKLPEDKTKTPKCSDLRQAPQSSRGQVPDGTRGQVPDGTRGQAIESHWGSSLKNGEESK